MYISLIGAFRTKVFNRVRENEVLYQTALSIAYGGVFHSHINALTLFLHCVNQCQLCGAYIQSAHMKVLFINRR